ncbi:MAG TPA: ATP-binding protein [Acidobacteriaceae bacterium]
MIATENEFRVLVVAPTGRDGPMICNLLASNGIPCTSFSTSEMARSEVNSGAGAVILAEEVLTLPDIAAWAAQLVEQPSWSSLPVIILAVAGAVDRENQRRELARRPLGNLLTLERPVRPETLVCAVQSVLRGRSRQYQMRAFLAERVAAEELLRKTEKLAVAARLASSFSHEINNPLASVTNLLYLIGVSSSLNDTKKYAEIGVRELARVSEIVTENLRFHKESTTPVAVQIAPIINAALNLYQARLAAAQITVKRDLRDCSPVLGRPGELRQLILNLIANAVDAIGRSGILSIRIASTREHNNGSRPGVRLTIGDTGSGIRPDIRDTLFEPFVSTKGDTGTGLGLWVSSEIVRRHGGTIQVKSRAHSPCTGTVFSVFLPSHPSWTPARHSEIGNNYQRDPYVFLA